MSILSKMGIAISAIILIVILSLGVSMLICGQ